MKKLILLYLTFTFGLLYLLLPQTIEPIDYFLFSDMKLHFATHIYFICEKLILIILGYVVVTESSEYRGALQVFLWLLILDLLDYLLTYSSIWFHIGAIPVSMNVVKCVVFGLTILSVWMRRLTTGF